MSGDKSKLATSSPTITEKPTETKEKMTRDKEDLEKQEYFHGFRTRKDVQQLLREPNEFLVRVTDTDDRGIGEIVVSVLNEEKKQLHLRLSYEHGLWEFVLLRAKMKERSKTEDATRKNSKRPPGFPSVVELVKYYKDHKTPGKAFLKTPILRPVWQVNHDQVEYKVTDLVGSGNFCHVYRGKYQRSASNVYDVAVKVCHEGKLATETNEESKEARKSMISEAQTMSNYVHE